LEVDYEVHPSTQIHGRPNPWKESKKNSYKPVDEKSGENTPNITKKKNDPYNLETRFTHKDQLY
jgi:hypothetical protein